VADWAKANPDKLIYSSDNVNGPTHIVFLLMEQKSGLTWAVNHLAPFLLTTLLLNRPMCQKGTWPHPLAAPQKPAAP
jgi:hypothetical protein